MVAKQLIQLSPEDLFVETRALIRRLAKLKLEGCYCVIFHTARYSQRVRHGSSKQGELHIFHQPSAVPLWKNIFPVSYVPYISTFDYNSLPDEGTVKCLARFWAVVTGTFIGFGCQLIAVQTWIVIILTLIAYYPKGWPRLPKNGDGVENPVTGY